MKQPLKALKELKKRYGKNFSLNDDERCRTIETALNRSEELEKTNLVLTHQLDHERKIRIRQEKKLKALEIIKEKPVLTPCIFIYETYEEYIKECGEWNKVKKDTCYTKEEFNLLKEVLL